MLYEISPVIYTTSKISSPFSWYPSCFEAEDR